MTKQTVPIGDLIDPVLNFDKLPDDSFVDIGVVRVLVHGATNSVWAMVDAGQLPPPARFCSRMLRWNVGLLRKKLRAMRGEDQPRDAA